MAVHGTVTVWLHQLQAGEALAVQKLWDRYFPRMVEQARRQLPSIPRRVADEEDVCTRGFPQLLQGGRGGPLSALVVDRLQWLLGQLEDEQLREIALRKLDGCTNSEIALELQCALSTVERRLRLIRPRLERHLNNQSQRGDDSRAVVSEPASKTTEGTSWRSRPDRSG